MSDPLPAAADTEPAGERGVEIVLHVPKCAGTTIEEHLERHLGEAFWSPPKRTRRLPLELFARKYAARPPVPPERIRAVSGHFIGRSVERLFAGRPVRRSVLLREPEALILSWYNYRMMRYRAQGRNPYPLALHLRSLPPDPLAHFLLAHWLEIPWARLAAMRAEEKLARLEDALAGFDTVGDIADCDRLVARLSRRLAIPETARPENTGERWRAGTGWTPLRREDLSEADRALLAARTRLDSALHARAVLGREAPLAAPVPLLRAELARPLAELARRRARDRPPRP
jgi:hypothetical protein